MGIPYYRKLDEIFRGDRSTWLKVGCGILVGLYVTLFTVRGQEKKRQTVRPTGERRSIASSRRPVAD